MCARCGESEDRCMLEAMARSGDDDPQGDAFKRAFGEVTPLRNRSPERAARGFDHERAPVRRESPSVGQPIESLVVEREANGIVAGRRRSAHASIADALEDPRLEVEAELDLHGRTTRETESEVLRFVRTAQRGGQRWVGIVVGKGLHSPSGQGALREHVVEALSHAPAARFVLAFRTAPRRLGGTGALVVRLVDRVS